MLILTFNTANDFVAPDDLIALIDGTRPQIAGLQELSARNAAALDRASAISLPHRFLYGGHVDGKGLLSSFPIEDCRRFELASGRSAIESAIHIQGRDVAVFVAHPLPPSYRRPASSLARGVDDVRSLLRRVPNDRPALLLGDFNFVRGSPGYRLVRRAGFVDIYRAAGSGPRLTYPTRHQYVRVPLPRMLRIDYIWATPHFAPVASWVGPHLGSDHRSLFAEVTLVEGT